MKERILYSSIEETWDYQTFLLIIQRLLKVINTRGLISTGWPQETDTVWGIAKIYDQENIFKEHLSGPFSKKISV